jgi:polysaccharide biosynthesis/export protein
MRVTVNRVQTTHQPKGSRKFQPTQEDSYRFLDQIRSKVGFHSLLGITVAAIATAATVIPSAAQTVPVPTPTQAPTQVPTQAPSLPASSMPLPAAGETASPTPTTPVPVPALTPSRVPSRGATVPPAGAVPQEDTYVLGAGDQIGIDIFDVPEFSGANGRFVVLVDGSINPPWVGRIIVKGLTLEQASALLTQAYAPYVKTPLVTVNLLTARTLRVSVVGQVKRPGSYIITPQGQTNQILVGDAAIAGNGANQWPTVTQAIQTAGGITQLANLRQVQLRRPLADGSEQVIDINLWELLRSGELSQDVALRDRDTLVVPKAENLSPDEALLNGSASFSPATIRVNVVGEVTNPGTVEVPPNTSLNQALLSAGGFDTRRARRSRVDLVRLNTDGTAVKRTVSIDLAAGINEETNPSLRDGDTIIIGRSGLTGVRDFVDDVFGPFDGLFGRIIDIFN